MRKTSRKTTAQRTWYLALLGAWILFGSLSASAQSGGGSLTAARPTGQGWFYDRPASTDPLYNTSLPNQGANTQFGNDHLYIGWDGADQDADKAEAIAAVNFDLFQLGIPDTADITNFKLTMIEHTQDDPRQGMHNTPNATTAYTQGIVACPMPQFIAGTAATPIVNAPSRDCGIKVDGVRDSQQLLIDPAVAAGITNTGFAWRFDLTTMARDLVRDGDTLSFVFEPKPPAAPQTQTWMLTFHNGDYTVNNKPLPGVSADIAWVASSSGFEETGEFFADESFSDSGSFSSSDVPSFSDFGGLAGELGPETSSAEPSSRPIAGVFREGKPADFWDISLSVWLALIFGLLALFAAGVSLLTDPAPARPPGAVSALMAGFTHGDGDPKNSS